MRHYGMRATWMPTVIMLVLALLVSCNKVEVSFDCPGLCRALKRCVISHLDAETCANRCYDRIAEDDEARQAVDSCAACIDEGYACMEIGSQCPTCPAAVETVLEASLAPRGDAGPDAEE